MRVLHVQHEDSLFRDADLARQVQQARRAGIPIAITGHTIRPQTCSWEQDADALVAVSTRGAAMLRSRWPKRRVEYVPHGCPTWFPPRKAKPGKVIGAFGFLEPYKGFWRLLDVVRAIPEAKLLLFSYAKSPELVARWEEAARGLRVRRIEEFLPAAEVARRLAAEADILAFWYDDIPHASASGAIRVGLATGVPVLASPTSWFQDLGDATYQPGDLIEGTKRLLEDQRLREKVTAVARDHCHENSWRRTAERHQSLWESLAHG